MLLDIGPKGVVYLGKYDGNYLASSALLALDRYRKRERESGKMSKYRQEAKRACLWDRTFALSFGER